MDDRCIGTTRSGKPVMLVGSGPLIREMGGWQSIATAPKDGSRVLLWEQYSDAPFVGYWIAYQRSGLWAADLEHVEAEGGWNGAIAVSRVSQDLVTHWMPLPPPPK